MTAIALAAALVLAQAAEPARTRASGYLGLRLSAADGWGRDPEAPPGASLMGFPPLSLLGEGNVQLQVAAAGWLSFSADVSLFAEWRRGADGALLPAPAGRNLVVPAELYGNAAAGEHLQLLVGRKRAVWGSGFAANPSDVLNSPKDPTDPTSQRAGAWMVRTEAPFERFTWTALWAPKVVAEESGLPRRWLVEPGVGGGEQLAALRLYALAGDADLNVAWIWSNRYADRLGGSHRLMASASRVFWSQVELHVEALAQRGRDALLADPACLPSPGGAPAPLLACLQAGRAPAVRTGLDSQKVYVTSIAGGRINFEDDSLISVEWLYRGAGLSPAERRGRRDLAEGLEAAGPLLPSGAAGALAADLLGQGPQGQPARFRFEPQRRHYLLAVCQKPRVLDDFTLSATVILGLEDGSGVASPAVQWSAREWLQLTAVAWAPFGPASGELRAVPYKLRAALEARVWY